MDPMEDATTRTLVRANDRSTSWEAATAQTAERRAQVMRQVMAALRSQGPMTDASLCDFVNAPPSSTRTRRRELEVAGWVTPLLDAAGAVVKRTDGEGTPKTVWRALADGETAPPVRPTAAQARRERERAAEHEAGLEAARRWASWHLGVEAYWADALVEAYLAPAAAQARLDEEMGA